MGLKFNPFTGKLDLTGAGGGSPTGPAGGDLTGTYPNPTVDGLQGRPVSNAVPVNGQVLQYDGANWVPGSIPSGGSGGGGVVYYLNFNTAADAPLTNIPQTPNATKELGIIGDVTATSYLSPILSTGSYDFLASFVTDLNVPSATAIPAGIWDFNTFVESTTTNSANQVYFKIEILKYDGVNAPTLLATSNDTYIYDPTEITQYVTSVVMPQTTILATDRIVVYLYGRAHQNNNRLTFHFGGQYPSHTHSTMPSVTGTGVVKVVNGVFQSPASTIVNSDVSASAAIDQSKIANLTTDLSGKVAKTGDTMTGKLILPASTALSAPLNIPHGTDPSSPVNGDLWLNGSLRYRDQSGVTRFVADTNRPNTFTQRQTITADAFTTLPALRITQEGSGEALRVEDDTTPDATAFVVSSTGRVGIGTAPDATVGLKLDSTGIKFSDNTVQTTAATSGVTSVTATAPITSSGGATPVISTSMATSRLLGRTTAGTGVAEEISTAGTLTLTGGTLTGTGVGGSVGAVDNAVLRADVGTGIVQNSNIVIDDVATATQDNVAIVNASGATNSSLVLTPKGTGAFILGPKPNGASSGGNARGNYASDLQYGVRLNANQVASGNYSFVAGQYNRANTTASFAIGTGNTVTNGDGAFALGRDNIAQSAFWGGAIGRDCDVSGPHGMAIGYRSLANQEGMVSVASGYFTARGDAQRARFVLRCRTTTNTGVEMALDGATTYLGIPANKVIALTINISGVKSDGSAVAHYLRQYCVKNVGGTSSEVYAPVTIGTDNASGTTIALSANNGDDTLRILVTGVASETWRWVAAVDAVEITYGT